MTPLHRLCSSPGSGDSHGWDAAIVAASTSNESDTEVANIETDVIDELVLPPLLRPQVGDGGRLVYPSVRAAAIGGDCVCRIGVRHRPAIGTSARLSGPGQFTETPIDRGIELTRPRRAGRSDNCRYLVSPNHDPKEAPKVSDTATQSIRMSEHIKTAGFDDPYSQVTTIGTSEFQARLADLFRGIDDSDLMPFYTRGRKYARAMTAAHVASAMADADNGPFYLLAADQLLEPLGEASAGDLRDFVAGSFREDENRAEFLLDNPETSEPSMASFGPESAAAAQAFSAIGRIVALMNHPTRRSHAAAVTRLIAEQVRHVAALTSTLPTTYEMAMLQGMGTSWPELDALTE